MTARRAPCRPRRRPAADPFWTDLSTEDLLDLRLHELGLRIKGMVLESRIESLNLELEKHGIRFRPHYWLSDEWFSPAGIPGIAIPFYLTHPRLMKLERRMMLEVEGASRSSCMRILRHEAGHALCHAYRLHRRRHWQRLFGPSSQPYPTMYRPRPLSKRYVHHLDSWYAQSHPDEDFAETFAVWMTPSFSWRKHYKGWGALKKLEYVHELMAEIGPQSPEVRSRRQVDPVSRLRKTLRQHYEQRRTRYAIDEPDPDDKDLRRLFSDEPRHLHRDSAAAFLRSIRAEALEVVSSWSSQSGYMVEHSFREMLTRCRSLDLRLRRGKERTKRDFMLLLAVKTMSAAHRGRLRLTL
ncbi:MAG: putative zinc-binding metallopeptidase [Acidobacteriota bacterium]